MRGQALEVQCQGFAVGLSVPARIASLTPGDPCWTVIFFLFGAKPQKTNNANRTNKPTQTTTTNASRAALGLKTVSPNQGNGPGPAGAAPTQLKPSQAD